MESTRLKPLYVIYQGELGFSTLLITLLFAAYAAGVLRPPCRIQLPEQKDEPRQPSEVIAA